MRVLSAKILPAIVIVFGITLDSYASGPGTTAANFLKIGIGAKATAMGGAFTALADDGTSIYWNPAGLAQLRRPELSAMYNKHFEGINQGFLSLSFPFLQGTIALGTNYVDMGDIEGRDEQGNPTGNFGASDLQATLAYAHRLSSRIMFGLSAGMVQNAIESDKKTAWSGNAGLLVKPSRLLSIGITWQNIGSRVGEDPLPLTYRGGVAVNLDPFAVAFDVVKPKDNEIYYCAGMEMRMAGITAIRVGYRTGQDENIGQGISLGMGLTLANIHFDYAYVPWGDLGNSQMLSMGIQF